jgi:hypothetical protein
LASSHKSGDLVLVLALGPSAHPKNARDLTVSVSKSDRQTRVHMHTHTHTETTLICFTLVTRGKGRIKRTLSFPTFHAIHKNLKFTSKKHFEASHKKLNLARKKSSKDIF